MPPQWLMKLTVVFLAATCMYVGAVVVYAINDSNGRHGVASVVVYVLCVLAGVGLGIARSSMTLTLQNVSLLVVILHLALLPFAAGVMAM